MSSVDSPAGPRRIAIDARHLRTSTGVYIDRLLAHLQLVDAVNQYTVILKTADAPTWEPSGTNFRKVVVPYPNYSMSEQTGFLRFLRRERFDLVHFCMPQQPILYRGPHVTTIHDLTLLKTYNSQKNWLEYHVKQFVGRFVYHRIAHSSARVLVPSRFTLREVVERLHAKPAAVVLTYEAAELAPVAAKRIAGLPERYVLYVGGQNDYKNIPRLAAAVQILRREDSTLHLVLAGRLDEAAERNRARFTAAGLEGIHFTGLVDDGELDWLYRNALVYAFPSLFEGFGLPGLEAMLRGTPVVSSSATCLPEIYGSAAEFFDPEDENAIAASIGRVIASPQRRRELIEAGHARAAEYSWKRMATETHATYLDVLHDGAGRSARKHLVHS